MINSTESVAHHWGAFHVNSFRTHLAVKENVAASTRNQDPGGVAIFYEHVMEQPRNRIKGVIRTRKPKRLPVVLTREEVEALLDHLDGAPRLVCTPLYGSGLRLLLMGPSPFGRGE